MATLGSVCKHAGPTLKERPTQPPHEINAEIDPPSTETDPAKITRPISAAIHGRLRSTWKINKAMLMHFIFDLTSPAQQFKQGMPHDNDGKYPNYNDKDSGNVMETDGDPPGFMVYMPSDYWYVTSNLANDVPLTLAPRQNYDYVCAINFNTFMSWEKGEVYEIKVGQWKKRPNKASYSLSHTTYKIPATYHQIFCQLVAEDMHANGQGSHESLR